PSKARTDLNSPGEFLSSLYCKADGHTANDYQPIDMLSGLEQYNFDFGFALDAQSMPKGSQIPLSNNFNVSLHPAFFDAAPFTSDGTFAIPPGNTQTPALVAPVHSGSINSTTPMPAPVQASCADFVPTLSAPDGPVHTDPVPTLPTTTSDSSTDMAHPDSASVTAIISPPVLPAFPTVTSDSSTDMAHPDSASVTALLSVTSNANAQSRSGRIIVPSTRADQLNKIGSNTIRTAKTFDGKENRLLTQPSWMEGALAHFASRDLGEGWKTCVSAWSHFEECLNYHAGKGLPGAKNRPEEWSEWTTKSHRSYANVPVIHDVHEFGLAIVKWWKHIQPKVRQSSKSLMPVPLADCFLGDEDDTIWSPLRKGGPNGMLVMMTLLAWWGQHIDSGAQWQENSRPLWIECVSNVRVCLELMSHMISPCTATPQARGCKCTSSITNVPKTKRLKTA
ncbi:hypothetical protein C0992_007244, partial [Termitomyces sp. T32_za158]